MVDTAKNLAVVEKFWEAVSARDIDAYAALFTADAVAHDPVNKPSQRTDDSRRRNMQGIFDAFAQIAAKADFVTVCGNRTASKWTVIGKTAGGDEVTIEGIDVITHHTDGRIDEMWGYFAN